MYLKLEKRLSPKRIGEILAPHIAAENRKYDCENRYEWLYVDLPGIPFSLDVTRDHGRAEIDDDMLDLLTPEEIEALPTVGATYIFAIDRAADMYVDTIPEEIVRHLCERIQSNIIVYPGRLNIDRPDPEPISTIHHIE